MGLIEQIGSDFIKTVLLDAGVDAVYKNTQGVEKQIKVFVETNRGLTVRERLVDSIGSLSNISFIYVSKLDINSVGYMEKIIIDGEVFSVRRFESFFKYWKLHCVSDQRGKF